MTDDFHIYPIWGHLSCFLQGEPILPYITSLRWTENSIGLDLLAFLSPTLKEISIERTGGQDRDVADPMMVEDYNLRVVLSALVSKSPSLSSLMLEGSGHPSSLDPIMELPDLRVMNLYSFDSNVSARLILSFKDMKNLRELHLSLPNAADFFVVESATGFLALEELFLEGELPCIAQFLETVESKKLLWIHLILVALPVDESLRTEQFEQFHLVLERFADCLERIDIIYKLLPHIKANIVEFLRPFDKLHELRTLNIDLRPSVKLDAASEDITQLFEAWPNLESFAVYASENSRGMPISVLSSVAEFCPLLEFIALPKLDIRPLKELKL